MPRCPQKGVHEGIRYNMERSIIKICPICDKLFLKNSRGNKKYCTDICSFKAKREKQKVIDQKKIKNRDKFELANYRNRLYSEKRLSNQFEVGTMKLPKVPVMEDGIDWDKYHKLLQEKKRAFGLI